MIRNYEDLSVQDKEKAVNKCLRQLISLIVNAGIRFEDNELQSHIDAALKKAEELQTPWFAGEMLLEDKWLKDMLEKMALADAQEAIYPDIDTRVVYIKDE